MADLFVAVKTDETHTPLCVATSLSKLEKKLGLKKRSLEYCYYKKIPNKKLQLSVHKVVA